MKYIRIFVIIVGILFLNTFINISYSVDKRDGIESFPDSYKPYLYELQKNHPNWRFVSLYTNLDWNYAINSENVFGKNLVPKSYSDRWKNTTPGEYNVEVDSGWVDSSRRAVEYTMDPRNFLNEVRIGPFLSHSSISGRVAGFEGLYNFYNIGATSSAEPMGAIKNGLRYARDGKGASEATKAKYLIPWDNKEKAITGGGIFIGSSYINVGQDTLYLQKFHVTSNTGGELFWHQYMTNVLAPYSESRSIYNGYNNTGILGNSMTFIIPVYNNMPQMSTQNPNILESDYSEDNTKVYADVTNTLNVRSGPSTSYELLTKVDRNVVMTRIAKGRQSRRIMG